MHWKPADMQVCYITTDMGRAIDWFVDQVGVGPFYETEYPPDAARYTYRGKPLSTFTRNQVAFGYRGRLQYELVETDNPVFTHVLNGRDIALHHHLQATDDFERVLDAYRREGFETLAIGETAIADVHFIDTSARIGHYMEVVDFRQVSLGDMTPLPLFDKMIAAADGWDGRARRRPMAELMG